MKINQSRFDDMSESQLELNNNDKMADNYLAQIPDFANNRNVMDQFK